MAFIVFARHRPIRTAFLVNSIGERSSQRLIDAIIDGVISFSNVTWGGRCNPLAIVNASGALSQDTWEELLQADVDEVYATSSIAQALLEEIDARVMPWDIRGPEHAQTAFDEGENSDRWTEIAVAQDGVPILPSIENLGKIENQNLFPLETGGKKLLLFEFSQDCPAILRRFLHRNFGTYYQWIEPSGKVRRI
jgi:hypothetical protein